MHALVGRQEETQEEKVRARILERFRADDALLTDSGTSALRLALEAIRATRRGPVALPAFCCYDVATAADGAGISVLLYDVDARTLEPDPASLREVLRRGAAAVVVAPLYGAPISEDTLSRLRNEGAVLIADVAQGAGAVGPSGQPVGAAETLSVLSFGRGKGRTGGGGGALLAGDERGGALLAEARRRLPTSSPPRGVGDLGAAAGQWLFGRPSLFSLPAALPFLHVGETLYREPSAPGHASRAALAILAGNWKESDREEKRRRGHARRLVRAIRDLPRVTVVGCSSGGDPGYLRLPVLCDSGKMRDRLAGGSGEALGLMPGYPRPLGELPGFRSRVRNRDQGFPGAGELARCLLTIPTHGLLSPRDLERIAEWVENAVSSAVPA